jgi:1,4-dihydroxy-2-naphthoyl-CoA hydrolase
MPESDVPSPADLLATIPYAVGLGVTLDDATPELVRGSLAWSAERCTTSGVLHGGAIMSLADTVGALCAFLNLPPEAGTATVESATNFFRGIREGMVHATARPLHVGRSFITVRTDLADDAGRLVAQTTQTQAVLLARLLAFCGDRYHAPDR